MGLLSLLPSGVKLRLLLLIISQGFDKLEAEHVGHQLNILMDAKLGSAVSNPAQKHLAIWLRQVAQEVEA